MRTALTIAICLLGTHALGQEVRVKVAKERPPLYVGRPAVIQFTVEGFDPKPTPTIEVERSLPSGLRARVVTETPHVASGYSNINGSITRFTRVTHVINYVVTADKPGDYILGPFILKQGAKEANFEIVPISFESVPEDLDMTIRLIIPEGNVYRISGFP